MYHCGLSRSPQVVTNLPYAYPAHSSLACNISKNSTEHSLFSRDKEYSVSVVVLSRNSQQLCADRAQPSSLLSVFRIATLLLAHDTGLCHNCPTTCVHHSTFRRPSCCRISFMAYNNSIDRFFLNIFGSSNRIGTTRSDDSTCSRHSVSGVSSEITASADLHTALKCIHYVRIYSLLLSEFSTYS